MKKFKITLIRANGMPGDDYIIENEYVDSAQEAAEEYAENVLELEIGAKIRISVQELDSDDEPIGDPIKMRVDVYGTRYYEAEEITC